jgi:acylphosphatase
VNRDTTTRCLKVMVSGHVQGVCFRHYTRQKAVELGISGWVRNLSDGHVEALICGTSAELDAMLAWLAHGPDGAEVSGCTAKPAADTLSPDAFRILY